MQATLEAYAHELTWIQPVAVSDHSSLNADPGLSFSRLFLFQNTTKENGRINKHIG